MGIRVAKIFLIVSVISIISSPAIYYFNKEIMKYYGINMAFIFIYVISYFSIMRESGDFTVPLHNLRFLARAAGVAYIATYLGLLLINPLTEINSPMPIPIAIFSAGLFAFLGGYIFFYFFVFALKPTVENWWKKG